MTEPLYRTDPYAREGQGAVAAQTEGGVVVEQSLFYPRGGGQPGDSGRLVWDGGAAPVVDTVKGQEGAAVLVLADGASPPPVGAVVTQTLDWARRHAHMRIHTALHLLSVVVPLPVTGGGIAEGTGRLDFLMPEPPEDRDAIAAALNELVTRDLPVSETWIDAAELDANPSLVKTMSVAPPKDGGPIRLVRIGDGPDQVDLQPCGGTHVARTGEIGPLVVSKIANKGKQNRRISIAFA